MRPALAQPEQEPRPRRWLLSEFGPKRRALIEVSYSLHAPEVECLTVSLPVPSTGTRESQGAFMVRHPDCRAVAWPSDGG
jgi:hypothetical protein